MKAFIRILKDTALGLAWIAAPFVGLLVVYLSSLIHPLIPIGVFVLAVGWAVGCLIRQVRYDF